MLKQSLRYAFIALTALSGFANAATTFTAPSAIENQLGVINIKQYLDLSPSNSANLHNDINYILSANASTYHYKVVFLPAVYKFGGTGLNFPSPSDATLYPTSGGASATGILSWDIEFRPGARLVYTGTGSAVTFSTMKRVRVENLTVDLQANPAGTGATALSVIGVWGAKFNNTTITLGATSHTGISMISSASPYPGYGSYENTFESTRISSAAGGTGVMSRNSAGDTTVPKITHIRFTDGYINGMTTAFDLQSVQHGVIQNIAMDTISGGDAYKIGGSGAVAWCGNLTILPGELPPASSMAGYHFNVIGQNPNMSVTTTYVSGYLKNSSPSTVLRLAARDRLTVAGAPLDPAYYASFISRYSYPYAAAIDARGGGAVWEIMGWTDGNPARLAAPVSPPPAP